MKKGAKEMKAHTTEIPEIVLRVRDELEYNGIRIPLDILIKEYEKYLDERGLVLICQH